MNSLVAALEGTERDTGIDLNRVQELDEYWADVRERYEKFDSGLKNPMTEIYKYEIPGGQYTNLYPQVVSLGLGDRFDEVKEMYKTVNDMLGDLVKVTPSSKMVGDLAIFMVQNNLTSENIVTKGQAFTFPDSVVSYFKGMMGQPAWGFPEDIQRVVLKGEKPITCRPGELLPPVNFDTVLEEVRKFNPNPTMRDVISYCLYPKVVAEFFEHSQEYGYISNMSSQVFFGGMEIGETTQICIEDGKTLVIKYLGLGEQNEDGTRDVHFELNGTRREVSVPDPSLADTIRQITMADPSDKGQVGSSIPGMISKLSVNPGDHVEENQVLAVVEAMKMETSVVARKSGTVERVLASAGQTVKAGELIAVIK